MHLRDATAADLPAINEIYNHCVMTSTCTFQITPATLEERHSWLAGRGPLHPAVVVEDEGRVIAWGSLQAFHKREAYAATLENSVYVHQDHHRRGLGKLIMLELIGRAQRAGARSIVALIAADQEGSLGLHRALGFAEAGRLQQAGEKFGRVLDVIYMQLLLQPEAPVSA